MACNWLVFVVSSLALVALASAADGCSPPQWIAFPGMKVASSVAYSNNDSLTDCQDYCLTLLDCVAVDYTTDGQCLTTAGSASDAKVAATNTTHYEAQRTCEKNGISCVYKSVGKFEWAGDIVTTTNATTIDACVAGCTDSSCTGFAWNPFPEFSCIKTSEMAGSKTAATIYTALIKANCSGECKPYTWKMEANMVSAGSTRTAAGDESAFACQLQCLATDGCEAIDYTGTECSIQMDDDAALSAATGTTHYTADQDCSDPSGAMSTMLGNKMTLLMTISVLFMGIRHM